jgi:hypothetical protein
MKLDVAERIRLLGILPEKGNLLTLKIVRTLRDELSFSEAEHKDMNIEVKQDRITWKDGAAEKDVEIGDLAKEVITLRLRAMDEAKELTLPDIDLWEKFIGDE